MVVAIDIDGDSIDHAQRTYPQVQFYACNVVDLGQLSLPSFDLACLFSSFYEFPDQQAALRVIRGVCRSGAHLSIFDYTQPEGGYLSAALSTEIGNPIVMETLIDWMKTEEWEVISVADVTDRFVRWYDALLYGFEKNQQAILTKFGRDWYNYVVSWYGELRNALATGHLGGSVIHATAAARQIPDG